eukprot:8188983-Pyramimonas_sp.AAC.1
MHDGRPEHIKRGAFSTPDGLRRGWSLTAAAVRRGCGRYPFRPRKALAGVALSLRHRGCAGGAVAVRSGLARRGR